MTGEPHDPRRRLIEDNMLTRSSAWECRQWVVVPVDSRAASMKAYLGIDVP
jgi:hypothetical protein